MGRESKQLADALRRGFDIMHVRASFADAIAKAVERGVSSVEEVERMVATLGTSAPDQAAALVEWVHHCLQEHGVALVSDAILRSTMTAATSAVPPTPPPAASRARQRERSTEQTSDVGTRFFWKADDGGDNQWYRRLAADKWYTDDLIKVPMGITYKLESLYREIGRSGRRQL